MTNIVPLFPHQPAPAAPTELEQEVNALELELAHLRLKHLRSEMRMNQTLLGWWLFKRALLVVLVLWLCSTFARAESVSKSFYNSNGSFAGSSIQRGNSGSYYDGRGSFSGSSVTRGNSTSYFDHAGRYSGSTTVTGGKR